MATRVKTIEYSTTTNISALAAATKRTLNGSTNIYIPETPTFVSVTLFFHVTNDITNTSAVNLTSPVLGISLGAVAESTQTMPNPIAQSGEKEEWIFSRNVTSYFTTNWTGTNMSWTCSGNFTGLPTNNHSAKLVITYTYDDTTTTHVKTIRIPIESTRTNLTTSWQTIGGDTAIPALTGSYLPEAGVTIRQIFLELWGNSGTAATTDYTWQIRINGGTAIDTYRHEAAMNSATWAYATIDITAQDLSSARSLEGIVNGITNRIGNCGGWIIATYEFTPSASTTIYNSLLLGGVDTSGTIGATTEADGDVWDRNIYIEEPDTITLKESAVGLFQDDSGGYTFNIRVSGNTTEQTTVQAYVNTAGSLQCGNYSMVHRIDSGGQKGQNGISLVRGKNLYRVIFYSGTAQAGWNLSAFLLLNYTSGKHTDGVGVHSHSVYQHVSDNITSGSRVNTSASAVAPTIPETYYNLIGFSFFLNYNLYLSTDKHVSIDAEVQSTDPMQAGNGWVNIYNGMSRADNENSNGQIYAAARNNFSRWNGDTDPDRLNLKTSRKYRLSSGSFWSGSMGYWYTYNNIYYIVSGTCTGYSGDGSGIPIDIYRVNTSTNDDLILNLTTTTGGVFTGYWVDNTDTLYAAARQDDTHVGRSRNGTAG